MTVVPPEGLFLAMDTSTPRGSVAVGIPGDVLGRVFLERQGTHASELVPAVDEALEQAGVDLGELSGIVVGAGPGSFTGVRVAAATAKGLAHALDVPMWAFSSLLAAGATADALSPAAAGLPTADWPLPVAPGLLSFPRCILFDARGDRVYAACYRFNGGAIPETVIEPQATDVSRILHLIRSLETDVAFAGDGAQRHQDAIRDAGFPLLGRPAGDPTGDGLLHLLGLNPEARPVEHTGRWAPEYLRASNAERERTR